MAKSKYADKTFWVGTADRAIASFAQGAIAALGLDSVGLLDVDWVQGGSLAGAMALLSLLTSVAFRGGDTDRLGEEGPGA